MVAAPEDAVPGTAAPAAAAVRPRRVVIDPAGPVLIEGPVEIEAVGEDPLVVDRFLVAICTCRRSRSYPLCDGTHRRT